MVIPSTPGPPLLLRTRCPRSFEISSVAHLLHQLFCAGRAFGCWLRHKQFGPLVTADRGFTPAFWCQGQRVPDFLPLSAHELPVLIAALDRSGLRSSFRLGLSVRSAFRPWSASLALPTAGPTMPSADFCSAVRWPLDPLSRLMSDTEQISRGKLNRLRCTTAGSTLRALDGDGLCDPLPARPALAPRIRFLFIGSHLCSTLPSDPASRR